MVQLPVRRLTLTEFLSLPETETALELIDGVAVPKMPPKRFHSGVQKALIYLLDPVFKVQGHFYQEWAVQLTRNDQDWMPVPDLTYVSFERLPADWLEDAPCPVPADLAIEIVSPDQAFGEMAAKAADYIKAGVRLVWVVDPKARTITVFTANCLPVTYQGDQVPNVEGLPQLKFSVDDVFIEAGLPIQE
ncbi:MAG: Uma2 family endonuclease [Cyanobacteria bacterium P01_A01_bin.105]